VVSFCEHNNKFLGSTAAQQLSGYQEGLLSTLCSYLLRQEAVLAYYNEHGAMENISHYNRISITNIRQYLEIVLSKVSSFLCIRIHEIVIGWLQDQLSTQ
jgi:hypothetical protein